jgi:hypothetical protein
MTVIFLFFFLIKNKRETKQGNQFIIFNKSISVYGSGYISDIIHFILKLGGMIPSEWISIYGNRNSKAVFNFYPNAISCNPVVLKL